MKILIVDDEKPARDRLLRLVDSAGEHEVVGQAANGVEAINQFNITQPDVVLLDIRMPNMDGIEAAQHLSSQDNPPAIIFTTAYGDHALQAFEAHAVDYLLKPIRKERLKEALDASQKTTRAQVSQIVESTEQPGRTHICVRQRGNLELIPVDDIQYFYAEHKYVTLKHAKGEALIEGSLVNLEDEFGDRFLRIHRNCIIAAKELTGLEKTGNSSFAVTLRTSDQRLEVSRRHLSTVRKILRGKK